MMRKMPMGSFPQTSASTSAINTHDYILEHRRHRGTGMKPRALLTVTDNWPKSVPVTKAEIDIFEIFFGDILDELFGRSD